MGLLLWCSHCKAWDCPLSVAAKYCWPTTQSQFICWIFVRFTFEKLLLTDAMRVGLRRGWKGGVGRLTARRRRLRRLWVQQRQQGAAIVPAGVVGEVGANETISEGQLLIYGHTRHLHNHPAVIPAVDWWRWCETKRETAWWHTQKKKNQNLYNYGSSPFSLLTVAVIQAEAAITQAQFPGPVWPRQAGWDPASVVPAAVRLWVHLQARLQKWQLGNVNLLNFVLVPGADIKKQEHNCPPPFQLTIKNCNTEDLQLTKELVMVSLHSLQVHQDLSSVVPEGCKVRIGWK